MSWAPPIMPQIPYELLRPIFEHLDDDKSSLCAISLCSSIFHDEAEHVLFSDVTSITKDSSHLNFLRMIAQSPDRLALLVRAYKTPGGAISNELWIALCDGLKAMSNIKHLDVCVGRLLFMSSETPASMLDGCTFQLERFEWRSDSRDAQTLIEAFLPGQVALKHLHMKLPQSNRSVPPEKEYPVIQSTVCPWLVSLECTWNMLKPMLPEHKIEMLVIMLGLRDLQSESDNIDCLLPPLRHLKSFRYPFSISNSSSLDPILLHCTSLMVLELPYTPNPRYESNLTAVLLTMPSLHTLILSRSPFKPSVVMDRQLIVRIFQKSEDNFKYIYVETEADKYARYRRFWGVRSPVIVSGRDVRKLWLPE